ncbi:MAG: exopolysaccharide biosynthesis polyprenyl glycosylphosphotransferase [Flavobacteriaceae bacterium]|nr:exopolysaccharide biosynthesis polyprenyl glycosylphosphotransferase [Flavobacteriaceae bacterium]
MKKNKNYISFLLIDLLIIIIYLWQIYDFTIFNITSFLFIWAATATVIRSYKTTIFEGTYNIIKRTIFQLFIVLSFLTIIRYYELENGHINNIELVNYLFFSISVLSFRIIVIFIKRLINIYKKNKTAYLVIGEGKLATRINTFLTKKKTLGLKSLGVLNTKNKDQNNYINIKESLQTDKRFIEAEYIFSVVPYISPKNLNLLSQIIEKNNKTNKLVLDFNSTFFKKTNYELLGFIPVISTDVTSFEKSKALYTKRIFDILFSIIAIILLIIPLIFIALITKLTSKGPVFYKQERVGKNGVCFNIVKFRSMFENAEKSGPKLASDNDPRITQWGAIMRKYRFDEFPQFFIVLQGKMSIVGPRPERKFYMDQIIEIMPQYKKLQHIKPGITSLGQTLFGYAENIQEMRKRARYDLLYLNNISIFMDVKIVFLTISVMFKGKGK